MAAGVGDGGVEADVSVEFVSELFSEFDKGVDDAEDDAGVIEMLHPDSKQVSNYKVLLDTGMTLKGSRKYFSKAKLEFYRGR